METVTLANGVEMPLLGFGTWALRGGDCTRAVEEALDAGYRLIDTAQMYGNETEVGRALVASNVPREEIFLTTKIYRPSNSYAKATRAIDASLAALGTDYVDLLLLHEPYPQASEMYRAIENAYRAGKARAIGISNYDENRYVRFLAHCEISPMVNQVEAHVFFQRGNLHKRLQNDGVILQAWAPLASGEGRVPQNPVLAAIGARHGKTAAQVALRFLVQRGISVIPKTSHRARMIENAAIFDFSLSDEEMAQIRSLDTDKTFFSWTEAY